MSNYPDFSSHGYEIKRQLGQNRLGGRFTYLATDTKTQQSVVIKQFQFAQPGASWGDYDAYESEIKLLKQLQSPSIPCYLDSFETPTGFCLVQHYIKAPSLAQPRHFTPLEIKQIAIAILEILVYLQRQRPTVIHRDIKPENILVDRSQGKLKVYLVDFGFARLGGGDVAASSVVKGTLGFMPPEQLFNRQLTKASDLYSLGATLICLLTKTKSLEIGNLIDQDYRINFKPLMPKLSRQFIDWLSKITAPSLQERYPNAVTALTALKPIEVVPKDPTKKLLIDLRKLSQGFCDAVLNDSGTVSKILVHLKEPQARKKNLVIGATLIVAGLSATSYWQNRYVRQLLKTNECRECNLQKAKLKNAYLEKANLKGANLKKANLEGAFLESADLKGANLTDANLTGANLSSAQLLWVRLENANLAGANLKEANLKEANLEDTNLKGSNLEGTNLVATSLKNANLEGANLKMTGLGNVNLAGADLRNANIASARLADVNLEGANLEGANLESIYLQRAINLRGANLKGAKLVGANLYNHFYLGRANSAGVYLGNFDLRGANLEGANLAGANLGGVNLEGANLAGANLEGTNLREANLKDANLNGVNLATARLEGAIFTNGTRY